MEFVPHLVAQRETNSFPLAGWQLAVHLPSVMSNVGPHLYQEKRVLLYVMLDTIVAKTYPL